MKKNPEKFPSFISLSFYTTFFVTSLTFINIQIFFLICFFFPMSIFCAQRRGPKLRSPENQGASFLLLETFEVVFFSPVIPPFLLILLFQIHIHQGTGSSSLSPIFHVRFILFSSFLIKKNVFPFWSVFVQLVISYTKKERVDVRISFPLKGYKVTILFGGTV